MLSDAFRLHMSVAPMKADGGTSMLSRIGMANVIFLEALKKRLPRIVKDFHPDRLDTRFWQVAHPALRRPLCLASRRSVERPALVRVHCGDGRPAGRDAPYESGPPAAMGALAAVGSGCCLTVGCPGGQCGDELSKGAAAFALGGGGCCRDSGAAFTGTPLGLSVAVSVV